MNYCILTFGCRVNQADSFEFENELQARGGVRTAPDGADLVIVNTCSVTAAADQAARNAIRRVARLNPGARIVATGCYSTRQPAEVLGLAGDRLCLFPNARKRELVSILAEPVESSSAVAGPGAAGRTAYPLRVQTGCDERCSYCVIPATRGRGRSEPLASIGRRLAELEGAGFKEIWITGVHLGSYGRDLVPAGSLGDLLAALDRMPGELTFRLSSLEPMDCAPAVLEIVSRSGRFMPHLHLPLQHASDAVLEAMRRPYTSDFYRRLVGRVRQLMPDAAIGADVIVGFPGETERDFRLLERYLTESPLTHIHVFPYSDRPGTAAAGLRPKVPGAVTRQRAERLRTLAREINARFLARQAGSTRPGLTLDDGTLVLTDNYLKLRIAPGHARNERVRVTIVDRARGVVQNAERKTWNEDSRATVGPICALDL